MSILTEKSRIKIICQAQVFKLDLKNNQNDHKNTEELKPKEKDRPYTMMYHVKIRKNL